MGRNIIVGDVHGCVNELRLLVDRLGLTADDSLIFVGDLVAKGPYSRAVLKLVRKLGATVVRGNHEERLLEARSALRVGRQPPKLAKIHVALLQELEPVDWAMLEAMPLWLDVEPQLRVVHGGIVPGISIAEQDRNHLLNLRSISSTGEASVEKGPSWAAQYHEGPHIVFGHNARRDPQLHSHATGLDTGCVYGGDLTALVLPKGAALPPPNERRSVLVTERARRAYADYHGPLTND